MPSACRLSQTLAVIHPQAKPTEYQSMRFALRLVFVVALASSCTLASAERWAQYYRTGTPRSHIADAPVNLSDIVWDLNEVDLDSIKRDGRVVKYRVRVNYSETGPEGVHEMQADCKDGSRGQPPDPRMRSTYKGTLGGEEVRVVCAAASRIE